MFKPLRLAKTALVVLIIIILAVGSQFTFRPSAGCAHSPHDVIDAVALSPQYQQDNTLYIAISDHLYISTDGGYGWKELIHGLDNKHLLSEIAISPFFQADQTLYLATYGDGVYRSLDAGTSWAKVNNGLPYLSISSISLSTQGTLLAAGEGGGLFVSFNAGQDWAQVMDYDTTISAMAFFPEGVAFQAMIGEADGTLYITSDNAQTWQEKPGPSGDSPITTIAISGQFAADNTLFVGTGEGLFKSTDGGSTYIAVNAGLPDHLISSVALSPDFATDQTVFLSTWNKAIFRSEDGGLTWQHFADGITCDVQADSERYLSPHYREVRLTDNFTQNGTMFLAGFDGLFKSSDWGKTWFQLETLPLHLVKGLAVSPGSAADATIAVTTYGGGAYTAQDRASRWQADNVGLLTTRLADIEFSPAYDSDQTIFSASRGVLLKSTNGGGVWQRSSLAFKSWRTKVKGLLWQVGVPSRLTNNLLTQAERAKPYATVIELSPNYDYDQTLFFGTRSHGVFKSTDGGESSELVWDVGGVTVVSLVVSPNFENDETLFASLRADGVYRTTDSGKTWQPANQGLTFLEEWSQSTTHHQTHEKDVLLAISPNYQDDQTVFAGSSAGLYKTVDGGNIWFKLEGVDGYIISLALSPAYAQAQTIVVSIKGEGLLRSEDGGETFTKTGEFLIENNYSIEHIAFSEHYPVDPVIYAAAEEMVFQSLDDGDTWQLLPRPARYENMREVVSYEGQWQSETHDNFSASSVSASDTVGGSVALNFIGTGVAWIGTVGPDQGQAVVLIDGQEIERVDQYSQTSQNLVTVFSITDLDAGPHTINIKIVDDKNPASTGHKIVIDAFDVFP